MKKLIKSHKISQRQQGACASDYSIRNNYSRGELGKEILKGLAMGGLIAASFALPNLPQIFGLLGVKTAKDRYRAKRAIDSLKRKKLIRVYEQDGEMVMSITKDGNQKILKYKFDDMYLERPKKWDKQWRVIVYDIPEKYKKGRDALTKKLDEMGLYPFQESGFVSPFNCKNEIDFIGELFNIRRHIHYFIAQQIDNEDFLKRHYGL